VSIIVKTSIIGGIKLRETAKVLRTAAREDLVRNLRKAIKKAGDPALQDLRAAARAIKVQGFETPARRKFRGVGGSTGLRNRIADATNIEVSATQRGARVSFHTSSAKLGSAGVLPRKFDSGHKFRHPIMGHRTRWADEKGDPWFFQPIKDSLPGFRDEIGNAIDETVRQIEAS
jgi:hypothetical protein